MSTTKCFIYLNLSSLLIDNVLQHLDVPCEFYRRAMLDAVSEEIEEHAQNEEEGNKADEQGRVVMILPTLHETEYELKDCDRKSDEKGMVERDFLGERMQHSQTP